MTIKTTLISILIFIVSNSLFSQNNEKNRYHEFFGTVTLNGKKGENVLIKAFDRDTCFSNFRTTSNGKFIFSGEAEEYFILQFEKQGYRTKKIIVNTHNTRYCNKKIKKFKFNVNLSKKVNHADFEEESLPVSIIEFSKVKREFKSKRYNEEKQHALSLNVGY